MLGHFTFTKGGKGRTAAAKSLQLCLTLCDPIDVSPPGSPALGSPGKNTGVGCHFLLQCMNVKSESEVASPVQLLATPWTAAYQAKERRKEGSEQERGRRETEEWENSQVKRLDVP